MKFQPGQSGNPAGKPKGAKDTKTIIKELWFAEGGKDTDGNPITRAAIATKAIIEKAIAGDLASFKTIVERIDGLPHQEVTRHDHKYEENKDKSVNDMQKELKEVLDELKSTGINTEGIGVG